MRGEPLNDDGHQLVRAVGDPVAVKAQQLLGLGHRPEGDAGEDIGTQWVEPELEARDNAEVAATPADTPEQLGILCFARADQLTVGGHQVDREQLVDGQAMFAHDPADAATKGEARQTGVGDDARGNGQPKRLRGLVELSEQPARPRTDGAPIDIHLDVVHGSTSMRIPSSQVDNPGKLWPPPRTAIVSPSARAARTAARTSALLVHRAISAGRRSIEPFQTRRCCS